MQLGGLNNRLQISRCFLNANGDHVNGPGLPWSKHGLRLNRLIKLSEPNVAEQILSWEANRRSGRLFWKPLMLFLLKFCEKLLHDVQKIPEHWKCPKDARLIFRTKIGRNRKFIRFWWSYMEMVYIILVSTRAQREGIWDLFLHSFCRMISIMQSTGSFERFQTG